VHLLLLTFKPSLKKGGNLIEKSHEANSQHHPPGQRTRGSRRSIKNLPSASKAEGSARTYRRGNSNPGSLARAANLQIRRTRSQAAWGTFPGGQIESVPPGRMVVTGYPPRTEHSGDKPGRLRHGVLPETRPGDGPLNPSCKTGTETKQKSGKPGCEDLGRWSAG
jgi:hypothetical protein